MSSVEVDPSNSTLFVGRLIVFAGCKITAVGGEFDVVVVSVLDTVVAVVEVVVVLALIVVEVVAAVLRLNVIAAVLGIVVVDDVVTAVVSISASTVSIEVVFRSVDFVRSIVVVGTNVQQICPCLVIILWKS